MPLNWTCRTRGIDRSPFVPKVMSPTTDQGKADTVSLHKLESSCT